MAIHRLYQRKRTLEMKESLTKQIAEIHELVRDIYYYVGVLIEFIIYDLIIILYLILYQKGIDSIYTGLF